MPCHAPFRPLRAVLDPLPTTNPNLQPPRHTTEPTNHQPPPQVLVLHLKRFNYTNTGGSIKLHKAVLFEAGLRLKASVVADDSPDK